MYALAFISDDINYIVEEALKTIPSESKFYQCIADVIKWYKENPDDWKATWFKTHRKWSEDIGSPLGVFVPFNIDAKINAAWVVMGLLYGNGDFTRTFEISTRCGDDADCNPASAGGILATVKGYNNIPEFWMQGLKEVEPIDFKYTTISLNDAYDLSFKHALEIIRKNGGKVSDEGVVIKMQKPKTVPLEVAFEGHYPTKQINLNKQLVDEITFEFEGIGFAVTWQDEMSAKKEHVFKAEMYIDDKLIETAKLPTNFTIRRFTLFWRYQLPKGNHKVRIKLLNPADDAKLFLGKVIVYDTEPVSHKF